MTDGAYYFQTPFTYTPTFGLDSIDGGFAQVAEKYIIEQKLGIVSKRLKYLFDGKDEVESAVYMKKIGFKFNVVDADQISEEQEKNNTSYFIPKPINVVDADQISEEQENTSHLSQNQKPKNWWEFWK